MLASRAWTSAISARSTASTPSPVTADSSSGVGPRRACSAASFFLSASGVERVDLGQRHDLRLVRQPVAIGLELAAHGLVGLARMLLLRGDEVQQHARALDMAEEPVADADALMRAFDQAGNVGQDELARVDARDAEVGMQRRERIVGDLRLRRA